MNRRSFFKTITGFVAGVYAVFVQGKAKAKSIEYVKVTECKNEDFTEHWLGKKTDAEVFAKGAIIINDGPIQIAQKEFEAILNNRRIVACGRRIKWSKLGDYETFGVYDYIDLPTFCSCERLAIDEDTLLWYGSREVWRIRYTGEGNSIYQFEVVSIAVLVSDNEPTKPIVCFGYKEELE